MGHKRLHFATGILLATLVLASSSQAAPDAQQPPTAADREIRVELFSRRQTTLSGEMDAHIVRLPFAEGSEFKQGEILVTLDCAMEKSRLDRAQAVLESAQAKVEVNARLTKFNAGNQLDERQAEADFKRAKAEREMIQVQIGKCQIRAPYPGRVTNLLAKEHQYIQADKPLLEIQDNEALETVFIMPSHWLSRFHLNDSFQVHIDDTQKSYSAKITTFGAKVDAVSQSIKVSGRIQGIFPELLPGMSGHLLLANPQ